MDEEAQKTAFFLEVAKILLLFPVAQQLLETLSFPPEEWEITENSGAEERGDKWFTKNGKQLDTEGYGPTNIKTTP